MDKPSINSAIADISAQKDKMSEKNKICSELIAVVSQLSTIQSQLLLAYNEIKTVREKKHESLSESNCLSSDGYFDYETREFELLNHTTTLEVESNKLTEKQKELMKKLQS